MCSRGVFQLKKLTVFFCDFGGSSAGVREALCSDKLNEFIQTNPQIELQFICKRNHHPHIASSYINGYKKDVPLRNLAQEEVIDSLYGLRNQLGRKAFKVNGTRVMNSKQSIQGKWESNMFHKYPLAELSKTYEIPTLKQETFEVEDHERNVRAVDAANKAMKSRPFIDYNRETL